MTYFLIIETSGEESFVALFKEVSLLDVAFLPDKAQSKELLPALQTLLKARKLNPEELSFIAIGKGPGSFTGTRIGVITAKTLSFSLSIPLVPFCSLERFSPPNTPFAILVDAHSHGCYLLKSALGIATLKLIQQEPLDSLLRSSVPLFSPHPERIMKKFTSSPTHQTILPIKAHLPSLAKRVYTAFKAGNTCQHAHLKIPYLYTP